VIVTSIGARSGKLRKTPLMRVEHEGSYALVSSLREVSGEERAAWWERAVSGSPSYGDYQQRTDRQIPVFVADPT
jgi:hypothetical protein